MSLPDVPEIPRSFVEWSTEDVVRWLSRLQLSQDYSKQFRGHNIDGTALLRLNPTSLSSLGITEGLDRVKLLQQITTMQADLAAFTSPIRQRRSSGKVRRFSEITPAYRTLVMPPRHFSLEEGAKPSATLGPSRHRARPSLKLAFPQQWAAPSPAQPLPGTHTGKSSGRLGEGAGVQLRLGEGGGVQVREQKSTHLKDKKKRLSRSADKIWESNPSPIRDPPTVARHDSSTSRLVEILREENVSLKRELDMYYQRVRKLMKLEQEVEKLREAHRFLEQSSARREKLEVTMRTRLEREVCRLKEANLRQRAELNKKQSERTPNMQEASSSRELQRRDTVIKKLLKQSMDAAVVRERLERDLSSTRSALRDKANTGEDSSKSPVQDRRNGVETETNQLYSQSIERLKEHLHSLQQISHKREELEGRVRRQLEAEIRQLRGEEEEGRREVTSRDSEVAMLQADLAKWEQRCAELRMEREMAVEVAMVPREARISRLERELVEKEDALSDLRLQRRSYHSQLMEAHHRIAELESVLSSLQATLVEKESMVLMLQQSFLESDDASPETSAHASPTQNRPLTPSGSTLSLGSTSSMASSLLSDPLSHSPTFKHRDQRYTPYLTNGGGAPLINSSLARRGQMNGSDPNLTEQEGAPPGTKPSTSVPDTLSSQVDPPHKSSLPTSFSHAPSTCDQSDSISSVSAPFPTTVTASSPRHRMRRVTSKTPPPDYHLQAPSLPRSLDREPQRSHTPNLQLFNTLFRDGVLGNHGNGSRGVKMMGRVFVHHHAISNPHRV